MAIKDKDLIIGIKNGNMVAIRHLNRCFFPKIRHLVFKNNGTLEDAQDVYQETIFAVFVNIMNPEFKLTCSLMTYFYSIARNQWKLRLRERKYKTVEFDENKYIDEGDNNPIVWEFNKHRKYQIYKKHFENLEERCRKMLELCNDGMDFKKVIRILKIRSGNYAYKVKHLCMQKLIEMIENDPEYKSIISEEDENE